MSLFAVLDVETTGLSPAQGDKVVEIAVVVLDKQFQVVRMFDSLVHPQRSQMHIERSWMQESRQEF